MLCHACMLAHVCMLPQWLNIAQDPHAHAVLGSCTLAGRYAKVLHNDANRGLAASAWN